MKIYAGKKPIAGSTNVHKQKPVMAGPGAGYTIDWSLESIDQIKSFTVRSVEVDDWRGSGYYQIVVDCDIMATITINGFSSYGYGSNEEIENVPINITEIWLDDVESPIEDPDSDVEQTDDELMDGVRNMTSQEFMRILEYCSDAEGIRSGSYAYGSGYLHATYDGTIANMSEDDPMTAFIEDKNVIDYIDKCVSGDCNITEYMLEGDGDDLEEYFEDYMSAHNRAEELIQSGQYTTITCIRNEYFERYNGDMNLIDSEVEFEFDE